MKDNYIVLLFVFSFYVHYVYHLYVVYSLYKIDVWRHRVNYKGVHIILLGSPSVAYGITRSAGLIPEFLRPDNYDLF